ERIADLNSRFHQLVQECAGSHRLQVMMGALIEAPLVLQTFREYGEEDLLRSAAHHLEIVEAFEARDADWAASVMRSHVLAARRVYRLRRHPEEAEDSSTLSHGRRNSGKHSDRRPV